MDKPLIAVIAHHLLPGQVTRWPGRAAYGVPDAYVNSLRRAGVRPALICPPDDGPAEEILKRFDGLLVIGGGDVHPAEYGEEPHPANYGMDPDRDRFEFGVVRAADRMGVATFAICRGAQVVNVAFGGTLLQHVPDHPRMGQHAIGDLAGPVFHQVKAAEGSRLAEAAGTSVLRVTSYHHQGIDRLGDGLVPVGWSEDGLVEAIEREDGWVLAVQWHPEITVEEDPIQQALFDAFAERARERMNAGRGSAPATP